MKTVAVFGGFGGIGGPVCEILKNKFKVIQVGSEDVDVTEFDKVESFFEENEVDIVINLSGYNFDSFMHKYDNKSQHEIDKLIDINVKGSVNIIRGCLPQMRARGFGRIILISSILADSPVVSTGIYAGTKGFLDSLAKTVALENANKGITCNTLQLGYFDGGLTYQIPENFRNQILESIPMKRFGSISELVKVVEMLVDVQYISGENIKVNGGMDF